MTALNVELARLNMVESQVRTWDVTDARVLELVARAPARGLRAGAIP